jgi:hypothetical protein
LPTIAVDNYVGNVVGKMLSALRKRDFAGLFKKCADAKNSFKTLVYMFIAGF